MRVIGDILNIVADDGKDNLLPVTAFTNLKAVTIVSVSKHFSNAHDRQVFIGVGIPEFSTVVPVRVDHPHRHGVVAIG
ncbi:hypothetical protein SDC9_160935 [bioreactor metagenome]|uniref:Uncharacterized protein n=1 Tax=bioreactor metagenome TaxID=1076179 RepID=A0A645FN35_9ZZZZ